MTIKITDNKIISDIQKEFNNIFPFLKIEFVAKFPGKSSGSEKILPIDRSKKICESRKIRNRGDITIDPKQTVAELECAFKEYYGFSVQVFRKSGNTWLQSTITEDWTLMEQNEHGEALSNLKADC